MENLRDTMSYILFYLLITGVIFLTLSPLALANSIGPDIYDQWNTIEEFEEVSSIRKFLLEKDWINNNVTIDELDYILVLVNQCSNEFFPSIPTSLVLSIISVESCFNKDLLSFSDDTGLMQIIPKFHKDRIEKYIYGENVDLYDPRLNIMVGMDYLDELLNLFKGDLERAVMAYNMGPQMADRIADSGNLSSYAKDVLYRMEEIELFLEGG